VHTTALSMYAVRAPSPGRPSEKSQQHAAIGTAIVNGDAGPSARLAAEHVRYAYEYCYGDWPPTSLTG
jgi:DNA-binding GntR family transcriptional regulator